MSGSSTGMVKLACGCFREFRPAPPVPGETVYCRTHRDYFDVQQQAVAVIRVRCRNCTLSRTKGVGGQADLTTSDARAMASGHVSRNAGHVVDVTDSDGVVVTISNDGQGELPFEAAVAERTEVSREGARMLRGAFNRAQSVVEPRSVEA